MIVENGVGVEPLERLKFQIRGLCKKNTELTKALDVAERQVRALALELRREKQLREQAEAELASIGAPR